MQPKPIDAASSAIAIQQITSVTEIIAGITQATSIRITDKLVLTMNAIAQVRFWAFALATGIATASIVFLLIVIVSFLYL
jgi:uncharacterized phage infection (PIP) family protein YhgE